jgi:hypothetical protein
MMDGFICLILTIGINERKISPPYFRRYVRKK